ncbi:hypothetical protein G3I71_23325 [Streptomyces sp. SID12501]|uniref:Uncharacterized protein n=1 Tax=Streptomyces sp. SID12501 TaxID=2706042 RepID=A0A6B3BWD5_9ACTN|nr:hypothetical protein [Streptomyces sp. SID12501]
MPATPSPRSPAAVPVPPSPGIRTALVTCTDGGCDDGPGRAKPGDPGHDPAAVAAMRRGELEASCDVLGVGHLELLGYADSGMMGRPADTALGSFWSAPVDEAAARPAERMPRHQPDVVVTYDENGFYGRPDHILRRPTLSSGRRPSLARGRPLHRGGTHRDSRQADA